MATVVILGAGDIGGALARQLAAIDLVSRIVIVDDLATVAAGKALDVMQSAPVDRYHTNLVGSADVASVVGAVAVVIADTAASPSAEWKDDGGLALLKRVAGLNQLAPIVCAGASQAGLIEKAVGEAGVSRNRVFGSAPEALRSAVIAITALEANAAPVDISLSVLGRPPHQIIVPWDEASIAGRTATQVLSPAQLQRLDARIARLWPPGPYGLASAAAKMIRSALTRSPRIHAAFVATARDEGAAGRVSMLPITLQPSGLQELIAPALSARDRVRLDTTLRS